MSDNNILLFKYNIDQFYVKNCAPIENLLKYICLIGCRKKNGQIDSLLFLNCSTIMNVQQKQIYIILYRCENINYHLLILFLNKVSKHFCLPILMFLKYLPIYTAWKLSEYTKKIYVQRIEYLKFYFFKQYHYLNQKFMLFLTFYFYHVEYTSKRTYLCLPKVLLKVGSIHTHFHRLI